VFKIRKNSRTLRHF